jgi:hypothetical protein
MVSTHVLGDVFPPGVTARPAPRHCMPIAEETIKPYSIQLPRQGRAVEQAGRGKPPDHHSAEWLDRNGPPLQRSAGGDDRYFAWGTGAAGGAGASAGRPGSGAGLALKPATGGAGAAASVSRSSGTGAGAAPAEGRVGVGNGGVCAPSSVGDGAAAEAETGGRAASLALVRACAAPSAGCRTTLTADDAAGAAPVFGGSNTVTAILPLSVLTTKL